jgi:hypothetical protein
MSCVVAEDICTMEFNPGMCIADDTFFSSIFSHVDQAGTDPNDVDNVLMSRFLGLACLIKFPLGPHRFAPGRFAPENLGIPHFSGFNFFAVRRR